MLAGGKAGQKRRLVREEKYLRNFGMRKENKESLDCSEGMHFQCLLLLREEEKIGL